MRERNIRGWTSSVTFSAPVNSTNASRIAFLVEHETRNAIYRSWCLAKLNSDKYFVSRGL